MDSGFYGWLFLVAFGTSALGGTMGMASGIFIVPVLTLFGHLDMRTAVATSLVSVIACSCGGAASCLRERLTNVRLALVLETATTMGALTGVLLVGWIPVPVLFFLFAAILLLSAWQMMTRSNSDGTRPDGKAEARPDVLGLNGVYPDKSLGREVAYEVRRLPLGMLFMYAAGLVSALLGIGSGVLKIPAMDTALRLPIKVSSATSNFMIGVTAAASAGAYFMRGDINPIIAGPVALGSVVGAALGSNVLMRLRNERIRMLFVVVLLILAVQMILQALGIHWGGHP